MCRKGERCSALELAKIKGGKGAQQRYAGVGVCQDPLLAAAPWGTLALYATYLGLLGYAIYSGGDHLD